MASKRKSTSPQIVSPFAPLEQLALKVLRRYGDMSPSTGDGETMLLFIEYANAVIDELHAHPYWEKGKSIDYYVHMSESRPIPDHILQAGMLAKFAFDQDSKKTPAYLSEYRNRMNTVLATEKFGVGAEFELQAVDYPQGGVK